MNIQTSFIDSVQDTISILNSIHDGSIQDVTCTKNRVSFVIERIAYESGQKKKKWMIPCWESPIVRTEVIISPARVLSYSIPDTQPSKKFYLVGIPYRELQVEYNQGGEPQNFSLKLPTPLLAVHYEGNSLDFHCLNTTIEITISDDTKVIIKDIATLKETHKAYFMHKNIGNRLC